MPQTSKYVIVVDNISSVTRTRDLEREFDFCGKIRDCIRDSKQRCALVEFERATDAAYAWRKMDGFNMDGRKWKVDWATKEDFRHFSWKWFEKSPARRSPSRSRSPSESRSRSRSPPVTPHHKDDRRDASKSPSRS